MKPLYESLLDSREARTGRVLDRDLDILIDQISPFGGIKYEVKNHKLHISKASKNPVIKFEIDYTGQVRCKSGAELFDVKLLNYCQFDDCFVFVRSMAGKSYEFFGNCNNCFIQIETIILNDKFFKDACKYMKGTRGNTIRLSAGDIISINAGQMMSGLNFKNCNIELLGKSRVDLTGLHDLDVNKFVVINGAIYAINGVYNTIFDSTLRCLFSKDGQDAMHKFWEDNKGINCFGVYNSDTMAMYWVTRSKLGEYKAVRTAISHDNPPKFYDPTK